jgi:hypothetical protein
MPDERAARSESRPTRPGSLRFVENRPTEYEFADIPRLPAKFGRGEFAVEMWVKPDASFPVGEVWAPSYGQLKNWSSEDNRPYSHPMWWVSGNWLLDGHTRPRGYGPGDTREGTLSLQFYGGGRLRFMFADKTENMPRGGVYAVQAPVTAEAPSLLDGKWHHVVALRRWREPAGATLELWIDGRRTGTTDIPDRTDMRRFWDKLAHPEDPAELGGWALGSEVMTAWNYAVTQFEDYKGLVDDLQFWGRALTPAEIAARARGEKGGSDEELLAHFAFAEGKGDAVSDRIDPSFKLKLHRMSRANWSTDNAPSQGAAAKGAP